MNCGLGNVKVCRNLIKNKRIKVNSVVIDNTKYLVGKQDHICIDEKVLKWPFVYYMLNKPKDYICANHDKKYKCVMELIGRQDCYCLGRLDIDTTGLLLITNDKTLSKRLLLPQNHVEKKYYVTLKKRLNSNLISSFNKGIIIDGKIKCKSASLEIIDDYHCYLTISEGKYHQIKKMFLSCDNQVIELKRIMFATIALDKNLLSGMYRELTNQELDALMKLIEAK